MGKFSPPGMFLSHSFYYNIICLAIQAFVYLAAALFI